MEQVVTPQGYCGNAINSNLSYPVDRRTHRIERRTNKRKAAIKAIYRGRRRSIRRGTDDLTGIYVDAHERSLWYIATGLMVLCSFDAFFTTILIGHGSSELNPLLNYLLQIDLTLFLAVKFIATGACISFLVLHRHHRLLNTVSCYHLLIACLLIYAALVAYELSMIRYVPSLV